LATFVPFPEFYVKKENGFVAQENCFVAASHTKQNQKSNDFSHIQRLLNQLDRPLADGRPRPNAKAVEFDEPNLASADSPDGAQLLWDCTSPSNLNRGDRSWARATSIRENNARISLGLDRRFEARPGQTALQGWKSTARLRRRPTLAKFVGRCRSSMGKAAAATNRRRKNSCIWSAAATLTRALDPQRVRDLFSASRSRGAPVTYSMNSPHF
jgi:hypothetical protein